MTTLKQAQEQAQKLMAIKKSTPRHRPLVLVKTAATPSRSQPDSVVPDHIKNSIAQAKRSFTTFKKTQAYIGNYWYHKRWQEEHEKFILDIKLAPEREIVRSKKREEQRRRRNHLGKLRDSRRSLRSYLLPVTLVAMCSLIEDELSK